VAVDFWLVSALNDLPESVKDSITTEIKTAFLDRYNAEVRAGSESQVAFDRALESLGNAEAANRKYRHQYLTEPEARELLRISKPFHGSRWHDAVLIYMFIAVFAYGFWLANDARLRLFIACQICMQIISNTTFIARALFKRKTSALVYTTAVLSILVSCALVVMGIALRDTTEWWPLICVAGFAVSFSDYWRIHLYRKALHSPGMRERVAKT